MNISRTYRALLCSCGLLASFSLNAEKKADAFSKFISQGPAGGVLADFSYAGYQFSEKPIPEVSGAALHVKDFGAIPDDGISDHAAIQAAFDAAESLGGRVIRFAAGEYTIDVPEGETPPLHLAASHTRLIGAGSGEGGTRLKLNRHLQPEHPEKMYSTPFVFLVSPKSTAAKTLAEPVGLNKRGGHTLQVKNVDNLKAGDWITLALSDRAAVPAFFGDREPLDEWTRLKSRGIVVAERHLIEAIDGNTLTLKAPLQVEVDAKFNWAVKSYPALEEVGIEKIRFVGNWVHEFVHHRSAYDDGAWSGLKLVGVRNSWVRDCVFENWNNSIRVDDSSAVSVLRIRILGPMGHFSLHTRRGYGVLVGLVEDTQGNHHGPSVGYQSCGTVFWRYHYAANSSFDAHSTGPYATLLDASKGGWTYGRTGGPLRGLPNHMSGLTLWNFERTGGVESEFNFWREKATARDKFLNPVIVGFHGKATAFEESSLGYLESLGEPVAPESLFEAQLAHRLGKVPDFLLKEKRLWAERK